MKRYFSLFMMSVLLGACGVVKKEENFAKQDSPGISLLNEQEPPRLVGASVAPGVNNVPLDAQIYFVFDKPIKKSLVRSDNIKLIRSDTGEIVRGETQYVDGRLEFFPERKFYFGKASDGKTQTLYSGLQADTGYMVELGDVVGENDVRSPDSGKAYLFSTSRFDHGFYWLGDDGEYEKASSSGNSKYFDLAKPTVIYIHGWQKGTSKYNLQKENPFLYTSDAFGSGSLMRVWRSRDFNVGVFFWSQFADENDVRDAEVKVWKGDGSEKARDGGVLGMRFRVRNGEFVESGLKKSVAQTFAEQYAKVFDGYRGPGVRFVGHSLGAQLAGHAAFLISQDAAAGRVASEIVPKRLAFLDAFWSKGASSYLGSKSSAEVFNSEVTALVKSRGVVVEQIKTSALGGVFAGDENLNLRRLSAFHRVWPRFISATDQLSLHVYASVWYLGSMQAALSTNAGFTGAAAADEDILKNMNMSRAAKPVFLKHVSGVDTSEPSDDGFEEAPGIETW
jgi:hypothetical protein